MRVETRQQVTGDIVPAALAQIFAGAALYFLPALRHRLDELLRIVFLAGKYLVVMLSF
jgi:hypothetical protein